MKVYDNSIAELDRNVVLHITGTSSNAYVNAITTITCVITDNDFSSYSFEKDLEVGDKQYYRTDTVRIPFTLSQPLPKTVTLTCSVDEEYTDATESDYTLPESSRSLILPAGTTRDTIILLIAPRTRRGGSFYFSDEKKIWHCN